MREKLNGTKYEAAQYGMNVCVNVSGERTETGLF